MSYRLQQSLSERPCVTRNLPSKRSEPTPPFSFSTTIYRYDETNCDFVDRRRRVTTLLTGVRYYGYRFYNPDLGRWINRDPIGERGDLNIYLLLLNNSVNMSDYLGLWKIKYHPLFCTGTMRWRTQRAFNKVEARLKILDKVVKRGQKLAQLLPNSCPIKQRLRSEIINLSKHVEYMLKDFNSSREIKVSWSPLSLAEDGRVTGKTQNGNFLWSGHLYLNSLKYQRWSINDISVVLMHELSHVSAATTDDPNEKYWADFAFSMEDLMGNNWDDNMHSHTVNQVVVATGGGLGIRKKISKCCFVNGKRWYEYFK